MEVISKKLMKKTVFMILFLTFCFFFAAIGAGELPNIPKSISEAKWLWCGPAAHPPKTAFFRNGFVLEKPVKRAFFYTFLEGGANVFVNGRPVALRPWEKFRHYRGHVKGNGAEIAHLLRPGKNVIAIGGMKTGRSHRGFILRGEIEFTDGSRRSLVSSAVQFRASGTTPEGWEKPEFDDSSWAPAWEMGDVRKKNWSIYGDVPRIYCTPEEYRKYVEIFTHGFPRERLLGEPEKPEVKVVYRGVTPGISFNGKISPPHIFSTVDMYSPEGETMVRKAKEAGIHLYILSVNDQTCGAGIGHYDFHTLDLTVRRLLAIDPEAKLIFSYRGVPLGQWLKQNPDECQGYAVKRENPAYIHWTYWFNPVTNSLASRKYREEVLAGFVRALAEFSLRQPWGRRVAAMHLGYGGSGDGMPFGCHSMPDTGKRMTEAFRRYLAKKYVTDEALRKAWNDPGVTLKTAKVPDQVQRLGSGTFIRNPADPRDCRLADYYRCYHSEFCGMVEFFGKAVKRYFPGRLAGAYHGYMLLGYTPEGSTANFEPLLKSPCIDYLMGTTVGYNLTDGLHRNMSVSLRRYGKFTSIEADIRTHLGGEAQWRCKTPEETCATITKVIGNSLFHGCAYHLCDFGREKKYFLCKEILEPVRRGIALWERFYREPPENASDTVVVLDPDQIWMQGYAVYNENNPIGHGLMSHTLQTLTFSGYSFDWMTLNDFLAEKKNYRAVIFLNQFSLSPEQRRLLLKKLRQPGVTAIWNCAPGIVGSAGYSDESMKELTGLSLKYKMEKSRFLARQTNGRSLMLHLNGKRWMGSPRVFSADAGAEILARYEDDGTPALVRRKLADGSTAVFSGIPINDSLLWAELLAGAGCHAYTRPGFFVRRNSKLLMVYSGKGGKVAPESSVSKPYISLSGQAVVKLEKTARQVTDLFTGKVIARDTAQFTLKSEQPHTWLLKIE